MHLICKPLKSDFHHNLIRLYHYLNALSELQKETTQIWYSAQIQLADSFWLKPYLVFWVWPHVYQFFPLCIIHRWTWWCSPNLIGRYPIKVFLLEPIPHLACRTQWPVHWIQFRFVQWFSSLNSHCVQFREWGIRFPHFYSTCMPWAGTIISKHRFCRLVSTPIQHTHTPRWFCLVWSPVNTYIFTAHPYSTPSIKSKN